MHKAILPFILLLPLLGGENYQQKTLLEYQKEQQVLLLRYQQEYLWWQQYHVWTKDQRCFLSRVELLNLKYGKALSELQKEYMIKLERRRQ